MALVLVAVQAQQAGAQLLFREPFAGAEREPGCLRLRGLGLSTRYLIGADGARSAVARWFGLGRNMRFLVGVEADIPITDIVEPGRLHCFLDRRLAPGYIGWAVPGVGKTQVGLACAPPAKPQLAKFFNKLSPVADLRYEHVVARRCGIIPIGGPVRPFASDRVMLIGDAAGLVSPLTAGGIFNAIWFGRRAAQAVSDHLFDDGPEPSGVLAAEFPRYRAKGFLRAAMGVGAPDWMWNRALGTSPFAALARRIYFHRRGPSIAPHRWRYFKPVSESADDLLIV